MKSEKLYRIDIARKDGTGGGVQFTGRPIRELKDEHGAMMFSVDQKEYVGNLD